MITIEDLERRYTNVASSAVVSTANALLDPGVSLSRSVTFADLARTASAEDWMATALRLATHLGPEFSSEDPHKLAGRGDDWFRP